jgi:hypothetical protein
MHVMVPAERSSPAGDPRWHQALAYALLGQVYPALGTQRNPDLAALVEDLDRLFPGGRTGLIETIAVVRSARDGRWPRVVPDDLRTDLGPAQFAAALTELRHRLGLEGRPQRTPSARSPDAAERALLRDVPPHHRI